MRITKMSFLHFDNATRVALLFLPGTVIAVFPTTAFAYVGPGAGLSVIGSLLAFVAAIVVAIFGFLFFPIRRILRRRKQRAAQKVAGNPPDSVDQPAQGRQALDQDSQRNPET
jgi:hypothetical protein